MPLYFADALPASYLSTVFSSSLQAVFGGGSPGNLGVFSLECFIREDGPQPADRITLDALLIPHFPITVLSPVCAQIFGIPLNARQHQLFLCDSEFDQRVHPVRTPVQILAAEPQPIFLFSWDVLDQYFELTNHGPFVELLARNDSRCKDP